MPVLLVLIHINSFLRFVGFNEFFLSFLVSVFIFKVEGVLQVDFRHLVLGVVLSQFESGFESFLVSFEVNSSFDESIFDEELSSFLRSHVLCHLNSNFSKLFGSAISLGDA